MDSDLDYLDTENLKSSLGRKNMKKILCVSLLSSVLAAPFAYADVKIGFEDGVSVLAYNGKEVRSNSFLEGTEFLKVENGLHQLLVQYTAEIKSSADDHELETTDTFVLLFEANDAQLMLGAPELKSVSAVEEFNKSGQWHLKQSDGKSVAVKSSVLKKEGFQLSRDYERELRDFNATGANAALPYMPKPVVSADMSKPVAASYSSNTVQSKSQSEAPQVNMPEQMLKFWYNQADQETRERFKKWIAQ